MKKNILITGSSGFIGRNLEEQLAGKYDLLTPSHSEFDLLSSESTKNYFQNHKIDVVVHCASVGVKGLKGGKMGNIVSQPESVSQNLRMFFNIVNNLQGRMMINLGTGAEYDKRFGIKNIKETEFGKHMPLEDYAFSKYVMSRYISNSNENIIHLRLFTIYGKYDDYKVRFISKSICRNLLGLPIIIVQNAKFDYLYIGDVVRIVDYFLCNPEPKKFYNVGSGSPNELLNIAQLINEVADKPSQIFVQNPELNNEYTCDITQLNERMGKFQFTPLRKGIENLYNYYKNNFSEIDINSIKDI